MTKQNDYPSPLLAAAFELDVAQVRRLLSTRVDVNAKDDMGFTPLYRVISARLWDEGCAEIVRVFLEAGANPNVKQGDPLTGPTPLGLAVGHKAIAIVKLLLEYGADVDFAHALHIAISGNSTKDTVEIIKMLIEAGGNIRLSRPDSDFGEFPLDVLEYLLAYARNERPEASQAEFDKWFDPEIVQEMRALLTLHPPASSNDAYSAK